MRILILTNEEISSLNEALQAEGNEVIRCKTSEEALELLHSAPIDLIIGDTSIAGPQDFPVLRKLPTLNRRVLSIILSDKNSTDERVKALEIAADACLIKPTTTREILATIRSIQRRTPTLLRETYQMDDLEIDVLHHSAKRAGQKLDLTPKEFALLFLLFRRSGEVLSRAQISEEVWGAPSSLDTNVVDVHIRRLRAKVDDPFSNPLIRTVRGQGYSLKRIDPNQTQAS